MVKGGVMAFRMPRSKLASQAVSVARRRPSAFICRSAIPLTQPGAARQRLRTAVFPDSHRIDHTPFEPENFGIAAHGPMIR